MILTDGAAAMILAFLALCVVALVALAGLGIWLFRRGWRLAGALVILAVAAFCLGVPIADRLQAARLQAALPAIESIPDTLALSGRRVLFIGTSGTICDGLCGDAVGLGIGMQAWWLGIGGMIGEGPPDNPFRGLLGSPQDIVRVGLGAPDADLGGMRFAEALPPGPVPPFDIVIIEDESGLLASYVPQILTLGPLPADDVQFAVLVYTDWPDPFAAPPPPMPAQRSANGWARLRAPLVWPLWGGHDIVPPITRTDAAWARALCAEAGPEADRDAFTHDHLCAR